MSQSTHQIEIRGKDATAGAFSSIKGRAAATGSQIRALVGSAIAAGGAYLGFSAIKGGIDQLGHLSDVAQKTSTSVDELTGLGNAMGALGIQNMSIEQLAKSFDYMAKTTGRSGLDGFYKTIDELGKIEDVAQRGQAAMAIFGRSGMEFMPLISAADTSVEALRTVVEAMPVVPQAAANAGDAMSDATKHAADQLQSIWLQGLAAVCGWFDKEYAGGVREASLRAGNYLEYYTKIAVSKCIGYFQKFQKSWSVIGDVVGAAIGGFSAGGFKGAIAEVQRAWVQGLEEYNTDADEIEKREEERAERARKAFKKREIAIEHYQKAYDKAAVSIKSRQQRDALGANSTVRSAKVSNSLIMGGSNAANKLSILGPQYQSESKKQTSILEKIAKNTEKTADNTESAGSDVTVTE